MAAMSASNWRSTGRFLAPAHPGRGARRRWPPRPIAHDRIRLAYVSADFNRHPVAYQIVELIEKHDRSRFEVIGISIGKDDGSAIRARLAGAFDAFHDLRALDNQGVAAAIRALEADILIDLTGHTASNRVAIMAHRPAPVQVSYLGYPATMAAPFMDYVVADAVVLPMEAQPFYPERIVQLPHSYWVGVQVRDLPPPPSRAQAGLPEQGFVFCAFNNHWKTSAVLFDIWMRLLAAVPGSVLWLKDADEPLRARLRGASAKARRRSGAPDLCPADRFQCRAYRPPDPGRPVSGHRPLQRPCHGERCLVERDCRWSPARGTGFFGAG